VPPILLDVTRLLYRKVRATLPTGIDRVSLAYVARHASSARAVLSLGPFSAMLSRRDSEAAFRAVLSRDAPGRGLAALLVAKSFLWRWLVPPPRGSIVVNTGHTGLENPHYGLTLRARGARLVTVIHDLIPITHPRYCRPREASVHATRMLCAARASSAIVANSRHTLDEFRDFCERSGVACPPATVAPLAPGLAAASAGPALLPGPYFVILGTLEPRKNHALLARLWPRLAASADAPRLVILGQPGWKGREISAAFEESKRGGRVIEKIGCGDEEVASWIAHARALLYPTFAEGYGLPATEAIARGVPVIASALEVFRETVGDIPEYAEPGDEARWLELITDYAREGSALRAAQVRRLQGFHAPTWEQHFAAVEALVSSLESGGAARASDALA
jgi:glycosyltransferase involved in cell wall biosynthesis